MTDTDSNEEYPKLEWWEIAEKLAFQTFQVQRLKNRGTAFLVSQGIEQNSKFRHYFFATAWHVIQDILEDDEFALFRDHDKLVISGTTERIMTVRCGPTSFDLGLLILRTADHVLQAENMMPVRGLKTFPSLGDDLGWYGYPGSLDHTPVFCRGTLACFKTDPHCYLINGVAYPGMSGSAVVDQFGWVIGVVSEWWEDSNEIRIPGMLQAAPSVMIRHVLEDRMGARVVNGRKNSQS